jgi:hypothetical protein
MRPARGEDGLAALGPDVLALVAAAGADAVAVGVTGGHGEGVLDLGERGRVGLRRQMREQAEGPDQDQRADGRKGDAEEGVARGQGGVM